jgi:hypothetical protein
MRLWEGVSGYYDNAEGDFGVFGSSQGVSQQWGQGDSEVIGQEGEQAVGFIGRRLKMLKT